MSKPSLTSSKFQIICAVLFQLFFAACLTIWYDVIIIPSTILCPPISKEYWFWYVDEYVSPVPYEGALIAASAIFGCLCLIVSLFGIYKRLKKSFLENRKDAWKDLLLVGIALLLNGLSILYTRKYGQPYRLYMSLVAPESLTLALLALSLLQNRRRIKSIPVE